MKSIVDIMGGMDHYIKSDISSNKGVGFKTGLGSVDILDSNQHWPSFQNLKQLFADIVKPIEQLVVNLFPLPPYQYMR